MNTEELIQEVQTLGGRILIDGERIRIQAPRGAITPDLKTRLRERKPELMAYLSRQPTSYDAQDSWSWIEERAGILEYEGGLRRDLADARAFQMWFDRFVGGDKP